MPEATSFDLLQKQYVEVFPDLDYFLTADVIANQTYYNMLGAWALSLLKSEVFGTLPYTPYLMSSENSKWVAMSVIQKGIRRGEPWRAKSAVFALFSSGMKSTVWRRLSVISLEDIGYCGLPALALNLAMVEKKIPLDLQDELDLANSMVDLMAQLVKDRSACDTAGGRAAGLSWCKEAEFELSDSSVDDLFGVVTDSNSPHFLRTEAYFRLRGMPKLAKTLVANVSAMGVPAAIEKTAYRYRRNFEDDMWASIPSLWTSISPEAYKIISVPPPETPLIQKVPGCALDQFTMHGKKAISYFLKSCDQLSEYCGGFDENIKGAVADAVFAAEGGALNQQLIYPGRSELAYEVFKEEFGNLGFSLEQAIDLTKIVSQNLPSLNKARSAVTTKDFFQETVSAA